jgi:sterol desaturase/sphingolipid hydroxylase (fatty acid hydroxylase superfamily)
MTAFFGVLGAFFALLERHPRLRFRELPLVRSWFAGDVVYLLTGWVAGTSATLALVVAASEALGTLGVPRLAALDLPLWVSAPLCLVALDFGNYAAHWLLHRFDALWEIHKIHHSSPALDWLATFRSHLLEQALRRLVAPSLLVAAGAPVSAILVASGVFNFWAVLNHSNLSLPLLCWLEPVLVTPRLHRLHHTPETSHQNLGTVFTLWDRLRGTLVSRDLSPSTRFGVPGELESYPQGWLRQLVEPPRRILGALLRPRSQEALG